MPKGMAEGREAATAAAALREMLRKLEIGVSDVKGRGEGVLDLLRMRDQVETEVVRLSEEGMDLRPESTRIEVIDNILARKAGAIGRELREMGGLPGARRLEKPSREHYWWYGDIALAERRRKTAIKSSATIIGVLAVLLLANFLMDKFFGLDPIEKQARGHTTQAEQYLFQGDLADAIAEYEQALVILPDLAEARLQLGVLYEKEGRNEEAQAAFSAAEAIMGDRPNFLVALAQAYQRVGEAESAMARVQEAIELAPDLAMAYMIRGGLYEEMDQIPEAAADFERAAELAHEQGNDQLYVMAKVRLGMGLQRAPGVGIPGAGF